MASIARDCACSREHTSERPTYLRAAVRSCAAAAAPQLLLRCAISQVWSGMRSFAIARNQPVCCPTFHGLQRSRRSVLMPVRDWLVDVQDDAAQQHARPAARDAAAAIVLDDARALGQCTRWNDPRDVVPAAGSLQHVCRLAWLAAACTRWRC